jgi:hypothetical protein
MLNATDLPGSTLNIMFKDECLFTLPAPLNWNAAKKLGYFNNIIPIWRSYVQVSRSKIGHSQRPNKLVQWVKYCSRNLSR